MYIIILIPIQGILNYNKEGKVHNEKVYTITVPEE